jgi:EmrB/QacA subfamily drug resistance transporter
MGAVFGFASIVGPSLGGWITDNFSWRWIFYVNLPVGIAALVVLIALMPPLRFGKPGTQVDYLGAALLVATLVPLLLAFTWAGSTYTWTSPEVLGLFAWSLFAIMAFLFVEMRVPQPVVDPKLFTNRIFSVSITVTFLIGAAMFGGIYYIPLFVQGVVGTSATTSGAIITPLMLTAIIGSVLSGQIVSRWGRYKWLAITGLLLMIAGSMLLLRLDVSSQYGDVLVAMLVMGGGLGLGMALYTIVVQNAVPQSQIGQATSGLTLFRQLGATIGLAVMGSFMTARFQTNMSHDLPAAIRARIPASVVSRLGNPEAVISSQAQAAQRAYFARFGAQGRALLAQMQHTIKLALAAALHDVFLAVLGVTLLAAVVVLFLPEIPLRRAQAVPAPVEEEAARAAGMPATQQASETQLPTPAQ